MSVCRPDMTPPTNTQGNECQIEEEQQQEGTDAEDEKPGGCRPKYDMESGIPLRHLNFCLEVIFPRHLVGTLGMCTGGVQDRETGELGTTFFSGSRAECLNLPMLLYMDSKLNIQTWEWSDIDLMSAFGDHVIAFETTPPVKEDVCCFQIEEKGTHPGYLHLVPHGIEIGPENNVITRRNGIAYLSSLQTEERLQDNMEARGVGQYKRHGPALNDTLNILEIDEVSCIQCDEWPSVASEWPTRIRHSGWPEAAQIAAAVGQGCHIVPVGYVLSADRDIEWRFSFSAAERILGKSLNAHQRQCYLLLKIVHRQCLKEAGVISTYYLKNILLWACEKIPAKDWNEDTTAINFLYLLDSLLQSLATCNLPHYFIPGNNLLDHIPRKTLQEMASRVSAIRKNPISHLIAFTQEAHFLSGPFSLDKAELLQPILDDLKSRDAGRKSNDKVFLSVIQKLATAYICDIPFSSKMRTDLRDWLRCIGRLADGPVMYLTSPMFPLICTVSHYQDLHRALGLPLPDFESDLCSLILDTYNAIINNYLERSQEDSFSARMQDTLNIISREQTKSKSKVGETQEGGHDDHNDASNDDGDDDDDEERATYRGEEAFMEFFHSQYESDREDKIQGHDTNIAVLEAETTFCLKQLLVICKSVDPSSPTINIDCCGPLPVLIKLFLLYHIARFEKLSPSCFDSMVSFTKDLGSLSQYQWMKPCLQSLLSHLYMQNNDIASAHRMLEEAMALEPENKVLHTSKDRCEKLLPVGPSEDTVAKGEEAATNDDETPAEVANPMCYGHIVPGFVDAAHQYKAMLYHIHSFKKGDNDNVFKIIVYDIIKKYALSECETESDVHHFNAEVGVKVLCGSILCDEGKTTDALRILMPLATNATSLLEKAENQTETLRKAVVDSMDPTFESIAHDFIFPGTQAPLCITFDMDNDFAIDEDLKTGLHGEYHTLQLHTLVYACYLATKCYIQLENIPRAKQTIATMLQVSEKILTTSDPNRALQLDLVCNNYNMIGFAFKLLGDHQRAVVSFGIAGNIEYGLQLGQSPLRLLSWEDKGAAAVNITFIQSSIDQINTNHSVAQAIPLTITYLYPRLSWEDCIKMFFLLLYPTDELFTAVRSFFKNPAKHDNDYTLECILLFMFTLRKWLPWLESLHAMIQAPTPVESLKTFLTFLQTVGHPKDSVPKFLMRVLPNLTGLEDIQKFLIEQSYPLALEKNSKVASLFYSEFKEASLIAAGGDLNNMELKAAFSCLRTLYPDMTKEEAVQAYLVGLKPKTIPGKAFEVFLSCLPQDGDLHPDISLARVVSFLRTSSFPAACLLYFLLIVYPDMEVECSVQHVLGLLYPEKSPEERLVCLMKVFFCNFSKKARRVQPPFRTKRLAVPTRHMVVHEPVGGKLVRRTRDIYWTSKGLDKPPI